jgi:hypothetical protein
MEVSGQLQAPATLTQGKSLCYPLDGRLNVPQSRSGRGDEEKNSQPLPGLEPPIIQPVAQRYTTELSCFTCYVQHELKHSKQLTLMVGTDGDIWKRQLSGETREENSELKNY